MWTNVALHKHIIHNPDKHINFVAKFNYMSSDLTFEIPISTSG